MIRFIHTADIHFGMENYGRIDAKTGIHTRLLDFYQSLMFCIDRAIEEKVDFFLFSGDAYKTAHPSPTQQRLLCDCFLKLFKAEIPLVIVVGNHDNPLSFGKAHALELFGQLPLDGFHVISKPTSFILNTKSGPVQLVGMPWPSKTTIALNNSHMATSGAELTAYMSSAVAAIISSYAAKLDPSVPAVLAAHLTISTGIFSGSEKRAIYGTDPVLLPSQVALEPFDYVALGHLHRHQNLNPKGHPPLVYAGSIDRIDFGERNDTKGFCLVTIHNKQTTSYQFIPVPNRRFIQLDVHLEGSESQTDHILHELSKLPLDKAVVKILYHLEPGKKDRVDSAALQQACLAAHHIAGIFPVHAHTPRERRLNLKVDMSFDALLDAYFQLKPEWKAKRHALIEKVHEIQAELEQGE